jgi:hypothetical protein
MAVLQSTNVQGALCVNGVAVGGGKDFKYCCFTSSTTFTPSQDLVDGDGAIDTTLVGAGGAGGLSQTFTCFYQAFNTCGVLATQMGSSLGGGGGVDNTITGITSTTGCTVTVGAGGIGTDVQTLNLAINAACYAKENMVWGNCAIPTASGGTGGNTEFGGHITYGGGVGGATFFGDVRDISFGYHCACKRFPGERNGGNCLVGVGGGADLSAVAYKGQKDCIKTGWYQPSSQWCFSDISPIYQTNYGDNYFGNQGGNAVSYSFTPPVDGSGIQNDSRRGCGFGNDGIKIGNQRVGTNKLSLFEDDPWTCQCHCIDGCTGTLCLDSTASTAFHCGGGGAGGCIQYGVQQIAAGARIQQRVFGGQGGDGLVVLKWHE